MITNIGPCTVELSDDGTLDTVLVVTYRLQPKYRSEVRFSQEYAAEYRVDGWLTNTGFKNLAEEAYEQFRVEMEYAKEGDER